MDERAALECVDLKKTFLNGTKTRVILENASLRVAPGEWLAISGPSGVGKSTLLHLLAGILPPDSGAVRWNGEDIYALGEAERDRRRASLAGLVFQFHHLLPDLTVEENIRLSLQLAGIPDRAEELADLIHRLGLGPFRTSRIDKLSGGERQRVAVARALAHRPNLIFADEPTGSLDERATGEMLDLFESARRAGEVAVVVVTHNPIVARRADRHLSLSGGRLL